MKRLVKERIKRWNSGDVSGLWAELVDDIRRSSGCKKKSDGTALRLDNARRARRAVEDGWSI